MDTKRIGKFISENRKRKGLTQEQLGNILGVSNKTISRWENGVSQTKGYWEITCVYLLANKRILLLS